MLTLDFLPPDPGLVNLIRQGLHAHKAGLHARERLAGDSTAPAATTPAATGDSNPRSCPVAVDAPLQRPAG